MAARIKPAQDRKRRSGAGCIDGPGESTDARTDKRKRTEGSDVKPRVSGDARKMTTGAQTSTDVGYKQPPTEYQWKSGQSGNPKGRPKGAKNRSAFLSDGTFSAIWKEESERLVTINTPDGPIDLSAMQAALRSTHLSAIRGNVRAQNIIMTFGKRMENESVNESVELLKTQLEFERAYPSRTWEPAWSGDEPDTSPTSLAQAAGEALLRDVWKVRRAVIERRLAQEENVLADIEAADCADAAHNIEIFGLILKTIDDALDGNRDGLERLESMREEQPELFEDDA